MDQSRFDDLARTLSTGSWSRRRLGRLVPRLVTGLAFVGLSFAGADAKPRKKPKKKKCRPACTGGARCTKGKCLCPSGTKPCRNGCIPAADCCPPSDQQTCQGRCGSVENACGQQIACGGCPAGESCTAGGQCEPDDACGANEIDCGGGLCIPDVEHACCSQTDCGGFGSFNDLVCNAESHRCECIQAGWGICQRFPVGTGLCGRCCPGAIHGLGEQCVRPEDDFICVNETASGCTCPPGKPQSCNSPGFGVRCRADFNDPRACGNSCETCDDHECCINGTCFNRMGCGPGFGGGGCTGLPCGSCTFFCPPETPLCCGVAPAAVPTCMAGTHCP